MRHAIPRTGTPEGRNPEALGIVVVAVIAAVGVTLLHLCLLGP